MPDRIVLLGASNLARGLAAAVTAAHRASGSAGPKPGPPVRFFIATGRGRAYGRASAFLLRGLPSIADCGLWRALEQDVAEHGPGRLHAVITDLGNDLAYGAGEEETFSAVGEVLDRLLAHGARPVVSSLPLRSLERFPIAWLDLVRRFFFPGQALPAARILDRAHRLEDRLRRHCRGLDLPYLEQPADWFGLDPIHHKRRHHRDVWAAMTAAWTDEIEGGGDRPLPSPQLHPIPPRLRLIPGLRRRLLAAWPAEFSLGGRSFRRSQPSARLLGGVDLSLY